MGKLNIKKYIYFFLILTIVFTCTGLNKTSLLALTGSDLESIISGNEWYDQGGVNNECGSNITPSDNVAGSSSTSTDLKTKSENWVVPELQSKLGVVPSSKAPTKLFGSTVEEQMWNYLTKPPGEGRALPADYAAAIMGNSMRESSLKPGAIASDGGYIGLFQWDPVDRGPKMKQAAPNWTTNVLGQLNYMYMEATGGVSGLLEKQSSAIKIMLSETNNYTDASVNFQLNFEGYTHRQYLSKKFAKLFFEKFSGKSIDSAGVSNCFASSFIDGFLVYNQFDPRWANKPYGSSIISKSGCFPSAIAMIINAFGKKNTDGSQVTPVDTANFSAKNGWYINGSGTDWSMPIPTGENWGLKGEGMGIPTSQQIIDKLSQGYLIAATGRGAKPFSGGGHIIVIRGYRNGKFLIGDSGHRDTSDKEWNPEGIVVNINQAWAFKD